MANNAIISKLYRRTAVWTAELQDGLSKKYSQ